METVLVPFVLVAGGAAVVWWLTMRPATRGRHAPRRARVRSPFQMAGAEEGTYATLFVFAPSVADDRPSAGWSAMRIVVTIVLVAAIGAGTIWVLGFFLNLQIARILGS